MRGPEPGAGGALLEVWGFSRVNGFAHGNTRDLRVLWALEEMGLPYEIVGMDHPNQHLDTDVFRAMNVFGQLPLIVDDGRVVTETGAILIYLARKSGMLMPRDLEGEAQVLRWSFAALSTVELPVLASWFVGISGGKGTRPGDALESWARLRVGDLDRWLADRTWVATDGFTVADILMAHVLVARSTDPSLIEPFPHVRAYLDRCLDRPAWTRTLQAYRERVEAT